MADIVQLEEKGNLLYPKTHTSAIDGLIDLIYPVGSIYMSTKDIDLNSFIGGTWERIKGKVLVGVDETDVDFVAGKTGGSKTHTLTVNEMPSHGHQLGLTKGTNPAVSGTGTSGFLWGDAENKMSKNSGGGLAHNNLQPYKTVFIWQRTA
ncbi:hypothetical protein IGJ02_002528 [Enterococcus sp. DIV0724b]|uniref:phage baseplate protein n=1 Tax=Enterococcus sp. DIV0724b TaxID=2774694 RepID=UPI003D2FA5DA